MSSQSIDLKSLIKCPLDGCNQTFNLAVEDLPDCARPLLTTCNKLMCYKCYNKHKDENGTLICPYCDNEHTKPTNAIRLHNIIKYFDIFDSFKKVKTDQDKNKHKQVMKKRITHNKINEMKHNIKEHVEQIIVDLNNHLLKMLQDLDRYLNERNQNHDSLNTEIIEKRLSNLENNLKIIENGIASNKPNRELKESVKKEIEKLEIDMKGLNDQVQCGNNLNEASAFLNYKKGKGIRGYLENIIGTFETETFTFTESYELKNFGNIIKEIRVEVFQNGEKERHLRILQSENNQLKRGIENLNKRVKMLTTKYCNNVQDDEVNELITATKTGSTAAVKLLIDKGTIVNEKNNAGWTALMSASKSGFKDVAQLLINNGAIVNEKDKKGWTALMSASIRGNKDVVKLLIDNGAIVNEKDNDGWTAHMLASKWRHKEVFQLLIDNGGIVNEKDKNGWTSLMSASLHGNKEIVQLLLDNGAILNLKDQYGLTALMWAN